MLDERAGIAAAVAPLPVLRESSFALRGVNNRTKITRVKAMESFFAKLSLIAPFFLADQSNDFDSDSRLTCNSTF